MVVLVMLKIKILVLLPGGLRLIPIAWQGEEGLLREVSWNSAFLFYRLPGRESSGHYPSLVIPGTLLIIAGKSLSGSIRMDSSLQSRMIKDNSLI